MAGTSAGAKKAWQSRRGGGKKATGRKKSHPAGKVKPGYKGKKVKPGTGDRHLTPATKAVKVKKKGTPAQRAARIGRKITARAATDVRAARQPGRKAATAAGPHAAKAKGIAKKRRERLARAKKAMGV